MTTAEADGSCSAMGQCAAADNVAEGAHNVAERAHDMVRHQWRLNNKSRVLCGASACRQVILDATHSAQSLRQQFESLTHYTYPTILESG